jgi:hypothetical protein
MDKPKFNPVVTLVKLNPEQAVLACSCYRSNRSNTQASRNAGATICGRNRSTINACNRSNTTRNAST